MRSPSVLVFQIRGNHRQSVRDSDPPVLQNASHPRRRVPPARIDDSEGGQPSDGVLGTVWSVGVEIRCCGTRILDPAGSPSARPAAIGVLSSRRLLACKTDDAFPRGQRSSSPIASPGGPMRSHASTRSSRPPREHVIFYDDACPFCIWCARVIARHARRPIRQWVLGTYPTTNG